MYNTWILRWDTLNEGQPRVVGPAGSKHAHLTEPGSEDGAGFAVFEGYLFDKRTYHTDPRASDAACIAKAYSRYGEGLFNVLRGSFCLAIWDPIRRCLVAGRDPMGLQPLYYRWDGRLFMLSPDIDQILAQPEVPKVVNRLVLAEYLMFTWHAHQRFETFYEGVRRLPAAHQLWLANQRLEIKRYWNPLPPGFQWASPDELETLPSLLERAVGRCLDVGADSLALSGGFDSVSIAVLAAEQLHGKPPLHAISLHNTIGAIDESETQRAVAQALGMPQVMRTVDECLDGVPFVEASLALSKTSPLPVLSQWQAMYTGLLGAAAGLGLSKLMLGTGGDEMFAVDLAYGADRLSELDLAGLWRYYQAMVRTSPFPTRTVARVVLWDGAAKPELLRRLRPTLEWIAPGFTLRLRQRNLAARPWIAPNDPGLRQAIQERRLNPVKDESDPGEGAYIRKIRGLLQSSLLMAEQEQGDSWARHIGFSMLYPYLDRDVVDLALRMHPEHLISGGRAKTPLRRLVADRLPTVDLPDKKVDFTRPVHILLRSQGQEAWRGLEGPQLLAELGLVEPGLLNPLMEAYFAGRNGAWLRTWLVLSAEAWLRAR